MELNDLIQLVNSGGSLALCICVYFLMKVENRLSRIEMALLIALGKAKREQSPIDNGHEQ